MSKSPYCLLLFLFFALQLHGQEGATSLSEKERASKNIKVFPNPATTVLNVLGLANAERAHISVTDQYGNLVLQHQWTIRNNALNLSVAQLQEGLHILSIQSERQSIQLKFYKQ
jgi:hypothetical protein